MVQCTHHGFHLFEHIDTKELLGLWYTGEGARPLCIQYVIQHDFKIM